MLLQAKWGFCGWKIAGAKWVWCIVRHCTASFVCYLQKCNTIIFSVEATRSCSEQQSHRSWWLYHRRWSQLESKTTKTNFHNTRRTTRSQYYIFRRFQRESQATCKTNHKFFTRTTSQISHGWLQPKKFSIGAVGGGGGCPYKSTPREHLHRQNQIRTYTERNLDEVQALNIAKPQ